jgi:hypothetical protein
MNAISYGAETLHIALVSLSQKEARKQVNQLVDHLYKPYRDHIDDYINSAAGAEENLYEPLKYYLFGNYDVGLISLVNNYKFSQRQVTPWVGNESLPTNAFQVIAGACPIFQPKFSLVDFFAQRREKKEHFVGIVNLKLTNRLLIGNGCFYLEPLLLLIEETLKGLSDEHKSFDYLVQISYSWFEVTIIVFSDQADILAQVIPVIRRLSFEDLKGVMDETERKALLGNSLYDPELGNNTVYGRTNPHLFGDTHSYFGVSTETLENLEHFPDLGLLQTQIDWEVKPGYLVNLLEKLEEIRHNNESLIRKEAHQLIGKMDYMVETRASHFRDNLRLLNKLMENEKIFDYARKVKTRLLFPVEDTGTVVSESEEVIPNFRKWILSSKAASPHPLQDLNDNLKMLKISRNVRGKLLKIYYNYNNGIQDPILFTYFLDFDFFIRDLSKMIAGDSKEYAAVVESMDGWPGLKKSVHETESVYVEMIQIFEEGYNIRMLNCHHYEDINDFDLDFNSSIQQLLTTYSTIAAHLASIFYKETFGPVVQLNLKNTMSNYRSINYDVYHLTSPEFVFFTLAKELMNKYVYADKELKKGSTELTIRGVIEELRKEVEKTQLMELLHTQLIEFEYYYLDAIKLVLTCNLDTELFIYWFWIYSFQNAALFDKSGDMNEDHFRKELTRLYFVLGLFGEDIFALQCPVPEIYFLWERHSLSIAEEVNYFFSKSKQLPEFKYTILAAFHYPEGGPGGPGGPAYPPSPNKASWLGKLESLLDPKYRGAFFDSKAGPILAGAAYTEHQYAEYSRKLEQGRPVYCDREAVNEMHFINAFMYSHLRLLYEKNGKQVRMLRRDLKTGKPLKCFIRNSDDDYLYQVDPLGGIFFANHQRSTEYLRIRNATLQSLWHFGMICKKNLHFSKEDHAQK